MNLCKNCKKETRNKNFCSMNCQEKFNYEIRNCIICKKEFKIRKINKKITCDNKNCENINRKNSIKNSFNKKYGVNCPSQLQSTKEKIKKYRKSGVYDNIIEATKKTWLKKYGNENAFRYGSKQFKEKIKEKYGDENYNNRKKFINTLKEKYNQKIHPNTLKIMKERLENNEFGYNSSKYKEYLKNNNITNVSQLDAVKYKIKLTQYKKTYNRILTQYKDYIVPEFKLNEYIGGGYNKLYKFRCIKCNTEFEHWIANGLMPRCPICYPSMYIKSNFQTEVTNFIKILIIENIIENDRSTIQNLELDIYIPNKNIAIELNGNYWHSELQGKDRNYHLNKTNLCNELGIRLIHIFEDEWKFKQKIVKSKLKYLFGIIDKTIYARKCILKQIDNQTKSIFLDEFHIQGNDNSSIRYGAYYEDELVAVMTFGKQRIALGQKSKENSYELIRFATKYKVIGIASKILKHFIIDYNPEQIISYADKRWSNGNLYEKIGFKKGRDSAPNYWYMKDYYYREHRFNYRKSELPKKLEKFDNNLTEWENMQLNGYDRIWDCGNYKYVWYN